MLRAYAAKHPAEAHWIEAILNFRKNVLREFDRLALEGIPDARIEESESGVSAETFTLAQP